MTTQPQTQPQAQTQDRPRPKPSAPRHTEPSGPVRGSIWLVEADPNRPPVGTEIWPDRPAVIISNDTSNARSGFVSVVYLSSSPRKRSSPVHIPVPPGAGRKASMALCEQVHTVDGSRLVRPMGRLPQEVMREINDAVRLSLGLNGPDGARSLFRKWEGYIREYGIDMRAETQALLGQTADERVEACERALTLMSRQLDAYRVLLRTEDELAEALGAVDQALDSGGPEPKNEEVV